MGYDAATAALKRLLRRDLFDLDVESRIEQFRQESDRAVIILAAGEVERWLTAKLVELMATINSDEKTRLFDFSGPLGTFSSRSIIAQALGLIDRRTRKQIDLLREMRNVAAHAHDVVTFETPEIRDAALILISDELRPIVELMNSRQLRSAFILTTALLNCRLFGDADHYQKMSEKVRDTAQQVFDAARPSSH